MSDRPTRRQLLAGGIGAAAVLTGCSSEAASTGATGQTGPALPAWLQDGKVLQQLLYSERLLEFAYEHALGSGYLKHDARELALLQLAHEQEHVAALQSHLDALNLPRSALRHKNHGHFPPDDVTELLGIVKDERTALQVVVQIENLAQSSYFVAAGSFTERKLVRLATEILACEAQHWTMLVGLLHSGDATKAVPNPTVRGSKHIGTPHT